MSDDFDYVAAKLARLERVLHPLQTLRPRLSALMAAARRWLRGWRRRLLSASKTDVTSPPRHRPA